MAEYAKKAMMVALYTRVSTDEQAEEGTSLEVQREFLENYARLQGYGVYYPEPGKIYEDDGYSGYNTERPALKRMLADARKKKFDMILVHKIDRFSRNLREMLNTIHELEMIDVAFKSASEFYDTTKSEGKFMFQQLGCFAEFERNRIKERVFPGMIKGVERGNWQGARYAPYGYSYDTNIPEDKRRLEIVKEEADIVKMIYMMYLAGQTTTQIAGYLYNKEYKTRTGGRFHSKLVCDILKNQVYVGNLVWNERHYDKKQKTLRGYRYVKNDSSKVVMAKGKHEPIIPQEDFDAVQKKLEQNRKGIAVRKGCKEYPLTGILVCAKCGHHFQGCVSIAARENKKTKWKRRYYRCCGRAIHYADCHAITVRADEIEEEIYAILDVTLSNPMLDDKRIDGIVGIASQARNEEIEKEIEIFKKKLDDNIARQEKLSRIYSEGMLAIEAYKNQIMPLRDEERQLKHKIQRLRLALIEREKSEEYQRLLKAVVNHFDYLENETDIAGKKGLLKLVFKNVIIKDGRIKSFELYPPFKSLYEGTEIKWQVLINQGVAANPDCVSTYARSDVR